MVELSCGMKCTKYMLFAFNFLFWVLGLVTLGVGIYSRVKGGDFDSLLGGSGSMASAANILIAAGIFVTLIGFVGCCGALRQNRIMLGIYIVFIVLIFILEIIAGIVAYTKKDSLQAELEKNLKKIIASDYGITNPTEAQKGLDKTLDWFQQNVQCCGIKGWEDWKLSIWYNNTGKSELVPQSCCKVEKNGCNAAPPAGIYTAGCVDMGKIYVKDHLWQVGGVGVGIAIVQLFGLLFAILLCRAIGAAESGNLA